MINTLKPKYWVYRLITEESGTNDAVDCFTMHEAHHVARKMMQLPDSGAETQVFIDEYCPGYHVHYIYRFVGGKIVCEKQD